MNDTLVITPTYNEVENLRSLCHRVLRQGVDLLIVDDHSPDGTGELAEELAAALPGVFVLHRPGKLGLGTAYRQGFAWALAHGYDVIVQLDADGSHQPEELDRLLAAVELSDVVIGSRWVEGGAVIHWPRGRRWLSRAGSWYARWALALPVHDVTSGYRAFRARAVQRLDLATVTSEGYCYQIEVVHRAVERGLVVREVPITFIEREFGASKMSGNIVLEAMINVTRWGLQGVPHHRATTQAVDSQAQSIPGQEHTAHV